MITKLVDKTSDTFDSNFEDLKLNLGVLNRLRNDNFKNRLFYESLKNINIDNFIYLYLLITCNFYSKYSFIEYKGKSTLREVIKHYIDYSICTKNGETKVVNDLDKLLLQLSSPIYNSDFEIDHIYPQSIKENYLVLKNINHIGNLCYISKINNQKKSCKLPSAYMDFLKIQKEDNLLQEFESQIFWNDLNNSFNFGEISNSDEFVRFLNARSYLMVEKIFLKLNSYTNESF